MRGISVGFWNEVARAIFGFQEHDQLQLEDAIRPVAVLELDRPEWGFLKTEQHWGSRNISQGAVALEQSYVGILNPTGSGGLVIVEYHLAEGGGAIGATLHVGLRDATFDATNTTNVPVNGMRDSRFIRAPGVAGVSIAHEITGSMSAAEFAAISPPSVGHLRFVAGDLVRQTPRGWFVVLAPGAYLLSMNDAVNTGHSGHFTGRARPLNKGNRA